MESVGLLAFRTRAELLQLQIQAHMKAMRWLCLMLGAIKSRDIQTLQQSQIKGNITLNPGAMGAQMQKVSRNLDHGRIPLPLLCQRMANIICTISSSILGMLTIRLRRAYVKRRHCPQQTIHSDPFPRALVQVRQMLLPMMN